MGQKSPGDSSHVHVPPYLLDKGFAKVFQKSKMIYHDLYDLVLEVRVCIWVNAVTLISAMRNIHPTGLLYTLES